MELYKFINENRIKKYNGGFIIKNNTVYANPTEEILKSAGFKPLIKAEVPEYNSDTQYVTVHYEDGASIREVYSVIDLMNESDTDSEESDENIY